MFVNKRITSIQGSSIEISSEMVGSAKFTQREHENTTGGNWEEERRLLPFSRHLPLFPDPNYLGAWDRRDPSEEMKTAYGGKQRMHTMVFRPKGEPKKLLILFC